MTSLEKLIVAKFASGLKAKKKTNRKKHRFEIHISDLRTLCLREFYILYRNGKVYSTVKEKLSFHSPERLLTFSIGDKIEEISRECLNGRKGLPMTIRIKDVYLVGSPDIILDLGNEKIIVEVKSMKKDSYLLLQEPLLAHEYQLMSYLWMAKLFPKLNLNSSSGILLYIPKEECSPLIKPFEVKLKPNFEKQMVNIVKRIKEMVTGGVIPKRICHDMRASRVKECSVPTTCFRGDA